MTESGTNEQLIRKQLEDAVRSRWGAERATALQSTIDDGADAISRVMQVSIDPFGEEPDFPGASQVRSRDDSL